MRLRLPPVSIAAVLQVILNVLNFPGPWWYAFPGRKKHRHSFFTRASWWASWASSPPSDCGC
jgi:hypothetical protein